MGDTARKRKGSQVEVRYQCIDSVGLQLIRIVANGKPVKELRPTDDKVLKGSYKMKFKIGHSYIRVEGLARDGRRAYSNPIYIREA